MFKYCWVWEKNAAAGFAQAKNKPMTKHEDVVVFSLAKTGHVNQCKNRMVYHPQGIIPFGKEVKNFKSHRGSAFEARKNARSSYVRKFTGYPNSVINIPVERSGLHPTQKPVALMEYLIKTYANDGETVLDFAMGSGTTGVAAKNLNRSFIGIELDETYFNIAKNRIEGQLI
jgi:site-specific DNA-methyltransferase (adenine-specific)